MDGRLSYIQAEDRSVIAEKAIGMHLSTLGTLSASKLVVIYSLSVRTSLYKWKNSYEPVVVSRESHFMHESDNRATFLTCGFPSRTGCSSAPGIGTVGEKRDWGYVTG